MSKGANYGNDHSLRAPFRFFVLLLLVVLQMFLLLFICFVSDNENPVGYFLLTETAYLKHLYKYFFLREKIESLYHLPNISKLTER